MTDLVLFYFFGGLAVVSAVLVITTRNVVHSAIYLITALLSTAGIFLLLQAQFLFAVQIILYVGGIMVLFIFVIMLVHLDVSLKQVQFSRQKWVAGLLTLVLASQIGFALWFGSKAFDLGTPRGGPMSPENTEAIGRRLFQSYMLPFEIASVLLLVAILGAVIMAKKRA
jgi:NADH-quinone oxidoreductase subunit J